MEEKKDSEDKLYNEINISDRLQKNQMSNLKNKRYSKFEVKKTTNYPTASNIRINMIEAKSNQSTFHEGFHSTQSRKLIKSTHRSFNSTK